MKTGVFILFVLLTQPVRGQEAVKFPPKVSVHYSYYYITDCDCEYEPAGGYPYFHTHAAAASVLLPLGRFQVRPETGYFRYTYMTNGVNDQYVHSSQLVYLSERIHRSRVLHGAMNLGWIFGNEKFQVVPELGFHIFLRKNLTSDYTNYVFRSTDYHPGKFPNSSPEGPPNSGTTDWKEKMTSRSISLGITSNLAISNRFFLSPGFRYHFSGNWGNTYYSARNRFPEFSAGITFRL